MNSLQEWLNRAALYELLALGFLPTTAELARILSTGEYGEALLEITTANGLDAAVVALAADELAGYQGACPDTLFHQLRIEQTRLFVGAPTPVCSPYAGVWWAAKHQVEPLLFVNKEAMTVERLMRSCGVGQPEGTNEPLDHIATELEFLQYLCLLRSGSSATPADVNLPKNAYEDFFEQHFLPFITPFVQALLRAAAEPIYRASARILGALALSDEAKSG